MMIKSKQAQPQQMPKYTAKLNITKTYTAKTKSKKIRRPKMSSDRCWITKSRYII